MDTDSSLLPSALVFSVFFLLFSYLSLAEHALGAGSVGVRPPRGVGFTVSSFKYACTIAVSLSGFFVAASLAPVMDWWYLTMLALGLLVALTAVNRGAYALALRKPERAVGLSRPVHRLVSAMTARRSAVIPVGSNGGGSPEDAREEAHAELQERVMVAAQVGSIDERDREMLQSILRLDGSTAREVMVPRLDIIAVEANTPLLEVAEVMAVRGHSRLPVYRENLDNIVGVVYSRDLLAVLGKGDADAALVNTLKTAFFIPESKRLDDLLEELQEKALQMAIVVDEYGGTEGLVTMEDLLEEIVGEIEDEFSHVEDPEVIRNSDGSALVDAGVSTDEIGELFGTEIETPEVDTVGGYVYRSLGRIPQVGDSLRVDGLRIEVVSMLGRRLRKLRIEPASEDPVASP